MEYFDGTSFIDDNPNVLGQFIAKEHYNVDEIKQIRVEQPISFLKDRIVLVDTPGLNDVNELRSDITYQYIPRADVVFFLLDCRTPLRKTEYDFISHTLLANGLDRIIFIANFADEVNEEEIDAIVDKMQRQLKQGTNLNTVEVIPFSSLEAIDAIVEDDAELYEISGMPLVKERMIGLCQSGTRITEKNKRYEQRFAYICEEFTSLLEQRKFMIEQSSEQLEQYQQQLRDWREEQVAFLEQLKAYKDERVLEFNQMARQSIKTFFNELEEELHDRIDVYSGSQVQLFFEKEIPNLMKRKMKMWIERYTPHIHELISKLEVALADILAQLFKEKVSIQTMRSHDQVATAKEVQLQTEKHSDPLLTSGLLVGGASTLLLALGGPIFLPILGMVGLPYLQRKMQKSQLDYLIPQMKSDISEKLIQVQFQFMDEVCGYIEKSANQVFEQSLQYFNDRLSEQEKAVREQLEKNKHQTTENEQEIYQINQLLNEQKRLTYSGGNEDV
ncbi:dynamin family protein [Ureibacillus xyleni]|uniref:Dynamin family protein n=1 Tax=Ureibacillus xyleni TaxID=614648 RepID=A0A285TRV3_9BACL|nr:dynamin family protein [Ureibacillus xyleni]